jgi:hypothetical protein
MRHTVPIPTISYCLSNRLGDKARDLGVADRIRTVQADDLTVHTSRTVWVARSG